MVLHTCKAYNYSGAHWSQGDDPHSSGDKFQEMFLVSANNTLITHATGLSIWRCFVLSLDHIIKSLEFAKGCFSVVSELLVHVHVDKISCRYHVALWLPHNKRPRNSGVLF